MTASVLTRAATPATHNWRLRSHCALIDPDLMHPADKDHAGEQEAKKVCAGCPVAVQCLAESLHLEDWHGIRAGFTGAERRNLSEDNQPKRCKRCNDLFVPRLDTQVRCRPCARTADTRARRRSH